MPNGSHLPLYLVEQEQNNYHIGTNERMPAKTEIDEPTRNMLTLAVCYKANEEIKQDKPKKNRMGRQNKNLMIDWCTTEEFKWMHPKQI